MNEDNGGSVSHKLKFRICSKTFVIKSTKVLTLSDLMDFLFMNFVDCLQKLSSKSKTKPRSQLASKRLQRNETLSNQLSEFREILFPVKGRRGAVH